jgi:exodeoxyribonuclease VII small subunit
MTAASPAPGPAPSPDQELSFEAILEQLQSVVEALEAGDAPLEQAIKVFERGVGLSRLGARRLDEAERRIEILLEDESGLSTRSLDDDEEASTDE